MTFTSAIVVVMILSYHYRDTVSRKFLQSSTTVLIIKDDILLRVNYASVQQLYSSFRLQAKNDS